MKLQLARVPLEHRSQIDNLFESGGAVVTLRSSERGGGQREGTVQSPERVAHHCR